MKCWHRWHLGFEFRISVFYFQTSAPYASLDVRSVFPFICVLLPCKWMPTGHAYHPHLGNRLSYCFRWLIASTTADYSTFYLRPCSFKLAVGFALLSLFWFSRRQWDGRFFFLNTQINVSCLGQFSKLSEELKRPFFRLFHFKKVRQDTELLYSTN